MKLKMSLPERPGWIFVVPGFDFVAKGLCKDGRKLTC